MYIYVYIYLQKGKCLFILVDTENKKNALKLPQESKLPSSTQHHLVRKKEKNANIRKILDTATSQKYNEIAPPPKKKERKREREEKTPKKTNQPVSSAARKVSR